MNVCRITSDRKAIFPAEGGDQFIVSQEEDNELFVDVPGYGSICIIVNGGDCLKIEAYPFSIVDEPIREMTIDASEFSPPDGEFFEVG